MSTSYGADSDPIATTALSIEPTMPARLAVVEDDTMDLVNAALRTALDL